MRGCRRLRSALAFALLISLAAVWRLEARERQWQTGTCVDAGLRHDPYVGAQSTPHVGGQSDATSRVPQRPSVPETATFTIEADGARFEVEEMIPVGSGSVNLTVGQTVTFAIEGKTLYVRDVHGHEHKLRVMKVVRKR